MNQFGHITVWILWLIQGCEVEAQLLSNQEACSYRLSSIGLKWIL
jgi:hypothetical protein